MKTQVIQLEAEDDFISIRDRMEWAKTPRILLVWPLDGHVHLMPLDLNLLKRHASTLGAELGLVTRNRAIRAAAKKLKLPVFRRANEAQKKAWPESTIHRPSRRYTRVDLREIRKNVYVTDFSSFTARTINRILVFFAGVFAVLFVVLLFLPSAQINLVLPEQKQSISILVTAQENAAEVQISGIVPMRKVNQVVSGEASALATGTIVVPQEAATGEALLMNLTEKAVNVPAGTVLYSRSIPPVQFITTQLVQVPAGKGKTFPVNIQAADPGPAGNVAGAEISLLEDSFSQVLAVTNPAPLLGGTQSTVSVATEQNKQDLRGRLLQELDGMATQQFSDKISPGDELFFPTLKVMQIIEETYDLQPAGAGQKLILRMKVEYSAGYAAFADLSNLASQILNASVPQGFIIASGRMQLFRDSAPLLLPNGNIQWQLRAERILHPVIDTSIAALSIQGRTKPQAVKYLMEKYGLQETPLVSIQPGWWPWLPYLPFRIVVSE